MEPKTLKGPVIVLAAYDLVRDLYPVIRGFPKSQQYLLGRRIEETALDVLMGLVEANTSRSKRKSLSAVDRALEKLRFLVRLSFDLRFISRKKYGDLAERVDEIGRMLGGWIKSVTRQDTKAEQASRAVVPDTNR